MPIRGAFVVVTGASSGIGAATAVEFARLGAVVLAVGRRPDRLAATVASCEASGGSAQALPLDVTSPQAAEQISDVGERHGGVDVVVNNAGSGLHQPVSCTTAEQVQQLLDVHLLAPIRLTTRLLPGMLERRRGAIVAISSISAVLPAPGETAYGAVKAAVGRWTHGLAVELHGSGVHAYEIAPGPIDTEIWEHVGRHYPGRLYPPEVVAQAVVRAVQGGGVRHYVPRRFGLAATSYALAGPPVRAGVRWYARYSGQARVGE